MLGEPLAETLGGLVRHHRVAVPRTVFAAQVLAVMQRHRETVCVPLVEADRGRGEAQAVHSDTADLDGVAEGRGELGALELKDDAGGIGGRLVAILVD